MAIFKKTIVGSLWSGIDRLGFQLIQVVTTVILARILTPDDFGLVGMIAVVFAISSILIDGGLSQALIRKESITQEDKSTVFLLNLGISAALYFLIWVSAPSISLFFEREELINLTRYMSLSLIFNSLSIVQRADLTHALDFRTQSYVNISSSLITSFAVIVLGYNGFGYYSLASRFVISAAASSIGFFVLNPWIPSLKVTRESSSSLFGFGFRLMLSGVINVLFENSYKIIIGKIYMAHVLGFYTQAVMIKDLFTKNLTSTFERVVYPILSKNQSDNEQLSDLFRDMIMITSFIIFPMLIGLLLVSESLVLLLLGEQWLETTSMFQIIGISGIFYHLQSMNLSLLKVLGRSDLFLKLEIYKKLILTVSIIVGIKYGIYGLLVSQVISSVISLFMNMYYTDKLTSYRVIVQVKDILGLLSLNIPLIIGVLLLNELDFRPFIQLLAGVGLGVILYLILIFVFKPRPVRLIQQQILSKKNFG